MRLLICALLLRRGAALRFATSYGDHMVLQRAPQRAVVWGYVSNASTTTSVSVALDPPAGAPTAAELLDGGVWRATLPAVAGGLAPRVVRAVATTAENGGANETAELGDVLFGDVWVCSGQSNMAFLLEMDMNGSALVADADAWPQIRLYTASKRSSPDAPLAEQPAPVEQPWAVGSSASVSMNANATRAARGDGGGANDDDWLYMSAVCWLYAREVAAATSLPVGVYSANWGGTSLEAWSTAASRAACPSPAPAGALFNGMIAPLLNVTIAGVVWYQGEANVNDAWDYTGGPAGDSALPSYACRFPALIADWRALWAAGTRGETDAAFPFGFVQLASLGGGDGLTYATTRWAQTAGYGYVPNAAMPNVFMAVAADMEDLASPYGAVHARWKQELGRRLGLGGRALALGDARVEWRGPRPTRARAANASAVTLGFDAPVAVGAGAPAPTQWEVCRQGTNCSLQTVDGWEAATALVSGGGGDAGATSLTLETAAHNGSARVVAVRYAWRDLACMHLNCSVYGSGSGLPAAPFVIAVSG